MSKADYRSKSTGLGKNTIYISVVVPLHNAAKHIENCITALLLQTYPSSSYEIIMVDNNSTDRSAEVVRKYPQVKLLSETKQGSYAARNRGVTESSGEVIAFTDSDCVPMSDWLAVISEALGSTGAGIIQGGRLYATRSYGLLLLEAYESEKADLTFSGKLPGLVYGYTNNMAVRREVLDRCGPFSEVQRGADSIFVNRAIDEYSYEIVCYAPEAVIRHSEIRGLTDYLRKRIVYGRSFELNYAIRRKSHRKMTLSQKFEIIRATIERKKYSLPASGYLLILVFIGEVFFTSGRVSARIEKLIKKVPITTWRRHTE